MKKLILIAAIAATAMAHAVTMATKGYVNTQVASATNSLVTQASTSKDYYKNSMWYLETGKEGSTVVLSDHACTYIALATSDSTTKVQIPAPVIVNGKNRSRSMILVVSCTADKVPTFTWIMKDAAGNSLSFFGREDDVATPIVGMKIVTISEVKQNTFFVDYCEGFEIFK